MRKQKQRTDCKYFGKIDIMTGSFFTGTQLRNFVLTFIPLYILFHLGTVSRCQNKFYRILLCFYITDLDYILLLGGGKGKYKESSRMRNILSAHFE